MFFTKNYGFKLRAVTGNDRLRGRIPFGQKLVSTKIAKSDY